MLPPEADAVLDEILATPDVGEIFVRAFRWAQRSKAYVLHRHSILTATARASAWHGSTLMELAGMLRNAALPRMRRDPDPDSHTRLPDALAEWLRGELRRRLVRVDDEHVFPVLLALMDAIDREMFELLWEDFYRRGQGRDIVEVEGERPFPKPVPALGPRDLSWKHQQSERGELPEYLQLEQYFGRLAVTTRGTCLLKRGLHPLSARGNGARPWRVAVLSILAHDGELEWRKPDGDFRFWSEGFSSPEARDAVRGRLIRAMKLSAEHRADLILIPELNTDGEVRELLLELLTEMKRGPGSLHPMVIAGCLHESTSGEPRAYRNRPAILTPLGEVPWSYHKVAAADWDGRKEALCERPSEVVAIDTPLGRIAVVMCLDFLTNAVLESVVDLRASVVVVLSMTSSGSLNLFHAKAGELAASTHAVTLFCNSSLHFRPPWRSKKGPWTLGFVYPHTTGAPRPLCQHQLLDVDTEATVAVYELEFCSRKGVIGRTVAEESLPAIPIPGGVIRPRVIGGGGTLASPVEAEDRPDDGRERAAAD